MQPEYKEIQRFRALYIWLSLICINGLFLYALIQQVILGKPFGNRPAPDMVLIIIEACLLLLLILVISIRLQTQLNEEGIRYRFFPFQYRFTLVEWDELSDAYMRDYNSFYEYGGWGLRVGRDKNTRAVNTRQSSQTGLQLEFKDGRSLLIGTARPEEMENVLDHYLQSGKIKWGT